MALRIQLPAATIVRAENLSLDQECRGLDVTCEEIIVSPTNGSFEAVISTGKATFRPAEDCSGAIRIVSKGKAFVLNERNLANFHLSEKKNKELEEKVALIRRLCEALRHLDGLFLRFDVQDALFDAVQKLEKAIPYSGAPALLEETPQEEHLHESAS